MKKLTILVLVLAMATMLFAQGGKEAAASDGRPTIRLLTDATGIDDKSFNAAAWRGIVGYYGDTVEKPANRGKLYDVVTAQTQDMYIPNLRQASDEGYDLIMVTGFTWADALSEVALATGAGPVEVGNQDQEALRRPQPLVERVTTPTRACKQDHDHREHCLAAPRCGGRTDGDTRGQQRGPCQ